VLSRINLEQLAPEARAEFDQNETDWRNETDKSLADFKDPKSQIVARVAATLEHLNIVRALPLPIYEPRKIETRK
jgi:hypothetical protein